MADDVQQIVQSSGRGHGGGVGLQDTPKKRASMLFSTLSSSMAAAVSSQMRRPSSFLGDEIIASDDQNDPAALTEEEEDELERRERLQNAAADVLELHLMHIRDMANAPPTEVGSIAFLSPLVRVFGRRAPGSPAFNLERDIVFSFLANPPSSVLINSASHASTKASNSPVSAVATSRSSITGFSSAGFLAGGSASMTTAVTAASSMAQWSSTVFGSMMRNSVNLGDGRERSSSLLSMSPLTSSSSAGVTINASNHTGTPDLLLKLSSFKVQNLFYLESSMLMTSLKVYLRIVLQNSTTGVTDYEAKLPGRSESNKTVEWKDLPLEIPVHNLAFNTVNLLIEVYYEGNFKDSFIGWKKISFTSYDPLSFQDQAYPLQFHQEEKKVQQAVEAANREKRSLPVLTFSAESIQSNQKK